MWRRYQGNVSHCTCIHCAEYHTHTKTEWIFADLPALHPLYGLYRFSHEVQRTSTQRFAAIPTEPNGGNHTPAFTKASATKSAHAANMIITRGLALTALRIIQDDSLFEEVSTIYDLGSLQLLRILWHRWKPHLHFVWQLRSVVISEELIGDSLR